MHRLHLPAKEEAAATAEAIAAAATLLGQAFKPVATFVVACAAFAATMAVTSRHSKRAPTAVQGRLPMQPGKAFALRIAETFVSLSTCGTLPLSRISITWLTAAAVLTTHAPQHQAPGA